MMQNPSSQNLNKDKKDHTRRDALLNKLKSMLLDNWGMKLLAILIALALWAGLITQDPTLLREKSFNHVPVNIIGVETLKRNGYIVLNNIEDALDDVTVRVNVPQKNYSTAYEASEMFGEAVIAFCKLQILHKHRIIIIN